jgi:hypothetical protein
MWRTEVEISIVRDRYDKIDIPGCGCPSARLSLSNRLYFRLCSETISDCNSSLADYKPHDEYDVDRNKADDRTFQQPQMKSSSIFRFFVTKEISYVR